MDLYGPYGLLVALVAAMGWTWGKHIPGLRERIKDAYAEGREIEAALEAKIEEKNREITRLTRQAAQWKALTTGKPDDSKIG